MTENRKDFSTEPDENGFVKWPKIKDLKSALYPIYQQNKYRGEFVELDGEGEPVFDRTNVEPLPVIEFQGTVKLHGTNAAINWSKKHGFRYQSRNGFKESGHQGFVEAMQAMEPEILLYLSNEFHCCDPEQVVVYGEWCGKGIQKKVAISELDKRFVQFPFVWVKGQGMLPAQDTESNPFEHVYDVKTYPLKVDLANLRLAKETIAGYVDEVEKECPIAKSHGVSGWGEGLVFYGTHEGKLYAFKAKGDEHKKVPPKPVIYLTQEASAAKTFVVETLKSDRLGQGLNYLKEKDLPASVESTGTFIKYVVNDYLEEEAVNIEEQSLHIPSLRKQASQLAALWYKAQL